MKQQTLNLTSKRKYYETQSGIKNLLSPNNQFEDLIKKYKKEETKNTQSCVFSLNYQDNDISLQFEDLINKDAFNEIEQQYGLELFDENGETVMDINSEKQLNSLLINQQHLSMEQKNIIQRIFYENLDNSFSTLHSDEFQNISNHQTTLTQDECSLNLNQFQQFAQNEQVYSHEFQDECNTQSEIDIYECQSSQVQIIEIGQLSPDEFNQSFKIEESHEQQSSYSISSENLSTWIAQQNQETLLFKKSIFVAPKQNQEKTKPQCLNQKKIRKRKQIKPKLSITRQKIFFKLVQQIPSILNKLKIKTYNQKGISNHFKTDFLQKIKQPQNLQMLE
ncbi:hypothetical protein ABPG74_010970 [Tetrahymena malaccensis]